jgi:hypothetical protein
LAAAVVEKSDRHRAQILIDDLGWAVAEMNDRSSAKRNILDGIRIADGFHSDSQLERGRLVLAKAKGLRHLAMLSGSKAESMAYLAQATTELGRIKAEPTVTGGIGDEIERDEAQLKHAEATVLAKDLDLDAGSVRPIADSHLLEAATAAILAAESAAAIFEKLHDDERHAKALILVEKIHKRLGRDVDAIQARARIRQSLRILHD